MLGHLHFREIVLLDHIETKFDFFWSKMLHLAEQNALL